VPASARSPLALVLVRNDVTTDARVRREVDALRVAGFQPLVAGVATAATPARRDTVAGAPLLRLAGLRRPRRRSRPGSAAGGGAAPPPTPGPAPRADVRLSPSARVRRMLAAVRFYGAALRVVARHRPSLLHCNDHNTMWVGVAARTLWGIPTVYDAHELWPDRNGRWEVRPWLLASEWLVVRRADATVTASPGYADVMARRYRAPRPAVIRNVPPARAARSPAARSGPFTLAYAGGLLTGRGLEEAIAALVALPGARLVLLGPGTAATRGRLRALAEGHGVADRLEIRPAVPPEKVVDALADSDVGLALIQPLALSYELTLPNKLFEYLAAGLPVIATDLPVLGRLVAELGVGETVPPNDPAAIAAAGHRLASRTAREQLAPHVEAARRRFTWENERPALVGLYRGLAGHTSL
jgi:glycosyltransferase involved in cell wall biosynthesis